MASDLKLSFPATTDGLLAALETAERYGVAQDLTVEQVSRVRIVVEELFTNTIKYGYGEECARPIRLRFSCEPVLTLVYEDEAPTFDPTCWRPEETSKPSLDDWLEGRQGIAMVRGLSSSAVYQPQPTGNCLVLTFAGK